MRGFTEEVLTGELTLHCPKFMHKQRKWEVMGW